MITTTTLLLQRTRKMADYVLASREESFNIGGDPITRQEGWGPAYPGPARLPASFVEQIFPHQKMPWLGPSSDLVQMGRILC